MQKLKRDLRWAFRRMSKNPGATLVIILSLGLAIGANTAIFSVVNAVFLRPLAIEDMDQLVRLRETHSENSQEDVRSLRPAVYFQWLDHNDVFDGIGAGTSRELNLTGPDDSERIRGAAITSTLFPTIGVEPRLGRNFLEEEDQPGRNRVVIINHEMWHRRFGGAEDVLGKSVTLNEEKYEIVGVMPARFSYPYDAHMWIPLGLSRDPAVNQRWFLNTPARLKPGVTIEQAQAAMNQFVQQMNESLPLPSPPLGADVWPMRAELTRDLNKTLLLLFAAAAFVLLIACGNVSNLLLAQGFGQTADSAVRLALGASRWRLIRQSLTQSLVLALLGGFVGILFTFWSIGSLIDLNPLAAIRQFDVVPRIDAASFGFTLAVSVAIGLLFGLLPAIRAARVKNFQGILSDGARGASNSSSQHRVFSALVVAEVAITIVVLLGAGLIIQSYLRLHGADRGFYQEDILTVRTAFSRSSFPETHDRIAFQDRVLEELNGLPGVLAAGGVTTLPLYVGHRYATYHVEDRPHPTPDGAYTLHNRLVTPGYFETMGIQLIKGRVLEQPQDWDNPQVAVVSESLANFHWPNEDPIGKRVKFARFDGWLEIVGVVEDVMENPGPALERPDTWYLPYAHGLTATNTITFVIRTATDPAAFIPTMRQAFRKVDRFQPIYDIKTIAAIVDERTQQERFMAFLYGVFGVLAILLAVMGIYAVLSFGINQRRREFGVRIAMGAAGDDIQRLVIRKAFLLTSVGIAFGVLASFWLTRLLETHLYGIRPNDPLTLIAIIAGLGMLAFIASYLPARRVTKINPVQALRNE